LLYHIIIVISLVIVTLNLILNLRSLKIPSSNSRIPHHAPRVSILIPARNEELNIATCLESLQKQDYPNFEILVLDDNSTDRTSEIVNGFAENDDHIRLIKGKPLPEGWAGKSHACYQLAQNATGSWLIFTDADTIHQPGMIRSVLEIAIKNRPSLLSGFPKQITDSLSQKIAVPVFNFIVLSWMPLWWLHRGKKPRPSFANGQFLMFPADEYWRMGGHEAVKSRILEDIWLGAEVYRSGGRVLAVDLSPIVQCHMYRSFKAMWNGFAKSIYAFTSPILLVLILGIIGYILYLGPFYSLMHQIIFRPEIAWWWYLVIFEIIIVIFMRLLVYSHFKDSLYSTIFHPIGFCFFLFNAIYVFIRRLVGIGISWKERMYRPESGIN
jgi:chlorobactene glucosyltransferase